MNNNSKKYRLINPETGLEWEQVSHRKPVNYTTKSSDVLSNHRGPPINTIHQMETIETLTDAESRMTSKRHPKWVRLTSWIVYGGITITFMVLSVVSIARLWIESNNSAIDYLIYIVFFIGNLYLFRMLVAGRNK